LNKPENKPRKRPTTAHPLWTPEEARKAGMKGGSRSTTRKKMAKIKNCTKKCPHYGSCPAITASIAKGGLCVIKSSPKEVQNYFFNLFGRGEEGVIGIALSLYFQLLLKTGKEPTAKTLRDAIATTLDLKKGIYGEKQKIELGGKQEIVIKWVGKKRGKK